MAIYNRESPYPFFWLNPLFSFTLHNYNFVMLQSRED